MTGETETLTSGVDPASFSSIIRPTSDPLRYVNGPQIGTYRLSDDRSHYGPFDRLTKDAENQVRDILDADDCPAVKSEVLYHLFLNTGAIEAAGLDPIRDEPDLIDSAINKAALTRVLGMINPTGGPDLFGLAVYDNPGGPNRSIAHLEQAGLCLPDETHHREDHYAPVYEAYVAMIATQLMNTGYTPTAESNGGDELPPNTGDNKNDTPATVPSEAALDMACHFFAVETKIAANHWGNVATRNSVKTYNPIDCADLTATLKNFGLGSWTDVWQTAYDATEATKAQPIDFKPVFARIVMHEPSSLTGPGASWAEADLANLKLWARVHMILGFTSSLSRDFDTTNFDFYDRVLSGAKKQRGRRKRAVSLVNSIYGEDAGREYVRLHFPESSKRRMEELVANLIGAHRVSIIDFDWLGEDTKAKALGKISKFTSKISYTNHRRDYSALGVSTDALPAENAKTANLCETGYQLAKIGKSVDKDEWLMNPQTINVYHESSINVVVFPTAILQPPFSGPEAEDAVDYGDIGVVTGHGIGHGFGDQGSQYDGDGKLNNWWTGEDRKNFEARTGALITQYDSFVPLQLAKKYTDEPDKALHVSGTSTIGKSIDDLGSVNIMLKAYAFAFGKAASKSNAKEDDLPVAIKALLDTAPEIDGFIGPQCFFLSYASIWRIKNHDELTEQYLQIDPHSPAEFRTNSITSSANLFYDVFGVTEGDTM